MKESILLINLGTPTSPTRKDVASYLREFLMDRRVIDLPYLARSLLVKGIIAPFRSKQSAHAYQTIWTDQGSPLLTNSEALCEKLKPLLPEANIALGMRYGKPSITDALRDLLPCEELTILPLYPQYASSSSGTAIEAALEALKSREYLPSINIIHHFYTESFYVDAMGEHLRKNLSEQTYDHLLFSYHGLPVRAEEKLIKETESLQPSSSYRFQCEETSRLIAEKLELEKGGYSTSFQSRLGKLPWLEPYTSDTLKTLADQGVKNLAVCCPSFVADCLETLEEIGISLKADWETMTGGTFSLVPALNASEQWIAKLAEKLKS
ncbi:MAG: ferrochelatase [Gammaproteobacteria bacterium CG11_big_fil_rev_8_21_14_0_20_46_22]|nr:MAG: ferrochelatase [Gammaproteobacteria bacterium CG12_big_fil_rev_8_21_14_0_65_46_12]PIR10531.1 MAG: ferrochelatase [Gammaproteobacteria bacterium CG11_big_fil_rev_8_21_14_0_20_46_22]